MENRQLGTVDTWIVGVQPFSFFFLTMKMSGSLIREYFHTNGMSTVPNYYLLVISSVHV